MMRRAWLIPLALATAVVWPVVTSQSPKTTAQETPPPPAEAGAPDAEGTEVLTRGPIHEAFAEPVTDPEPTLVVPKNPPEDIDEIPPEYAPEGEDAIWIKGYWAWDDEREDYIWISGVHRVPPPGMRWVAGYWAEADGGWQWNRGFWTSTESAELEYREPPPTSLEEGPSSPSPGDDYFYVPGNWGYYETGYRWTPGYWALYRPNWCWVPARWVWTPRGCIWLAGYWDRPFAHRGFCYAPIFFHRPIYAAPGYYYRPWCGLNVGNLFVHFWVRPRYCHYYFGNYYGVHNRFGISPWHSYYGRRGLYDPILSFNVAYFRTRGVNYVDRIGGWHNYYDRHVDRRPPITFADQRRLASQVNITNITQINKITDASVKQNFLAGQVGDLARLESNPVKLRHLTADQQQRATQRARQVSDEITEVRKQRREIERVAKIDRPDRGPDASVKGEKGAKGAEAGAKGKSGVEVGGKGRPGAEGRAEVRARLKLPESRVAVQQPRVEVPERPDRRQPAGGQTRVGPDGSGKKGGADRSARTPDGKQNPDRVKGIDRTKQPDIDGGKAKGKAKGGERTDGKTPRIDRPEEPGTGRPELPRVKGGEPPRPGPRVDQPEGGRPDREPKAGGNRPGGAKGKGSKGDAPRSSERPKIDDPRAEPRVERPQPRFPEPILNRPEAPKNRPEPRSERPQPRFPEPLVERPAPRVERPEPRVDRPLPAPRLEKPSPRSERPSPTVEQPAPRAERSNPAPRIEQPRVERSAPAPRLERPSSSRPASSSSRGKRRDRD